MEKNPKKIKNIEKKTKNKILEIRDNRKKNLRMQRTRIQKYITVKHQKCEN